MTLGYSIRIASVQTGIPAETLRMWERRYGFPKPARTAGGGRLYTEADVARLRLIGRARDAGFRPGDVMTLEERALEALLDPSRARAPAIDRSLPDFDALLDAAAHDDVSTFRRSLRALAALHGPAGFVTNVADPLAVRLGEAWACGDIGIRHEHLASNALSTQLRLLLATLEDAEDAGVPREKRPVVVLATLPSEVHVLGLEMVAVYLAAHHASPRLVGADTPPEEIAHAASEMKAVAVGVSVSTASDPGLAGRHLETLGRALAKTKPRPSLWVGGANAEHIGVRPPLKVVRNWSEIDAELRALA